MHVPEPHVLPHVVQLMHMPVPLKQFVLVPAQTQLLFEHFPATWVQSILVAPQQRSEPDG